MSVASRARSSGLALLALLVALSGCERSSSRETPPPPSTPSPAEPTAPAAPAQEEAASGEAREVEIATEDGFTLGATLYPGATPDAPAVILAHQVGSTRAEWADLVAALREEPALTVLTFDLRGHGQSTRGPRGETASFGSFDTDAWSATSADVAAAVAYLSGPGCPVRPRRIGLVGSSIGATAVIRAAAGDRNLDPLVVLSPGRAYRGVDAILAATELPPRSLLAVSAREEADSVETGAALARITRGRAALVDGAAHGVALFAADETLLETVTTFLREGLARPPSASAPPVEAPPAEGVEAAAPPPEAPSPEAPPPAAPSELPR